MASSLSSGLRRTRSSSATFHKVHKYYVGEQIAKGSFSSIYSAYRSSDYMTCAVKMISKRRFKCESIKEFIFSEKIIAPLLDHPHLMKIYETIESNGQLFQIQDLCETGDLLSYVINMSPSRNIILRIIDEILSGIEYMHSLNICHRDIKPENVLLTDELSAKLTDFGFTCFTFEGKPFHNSKCGSFGYAAPEVYSTDNKDTYDGKKADVWSIGVLILTLFTKSCPFSSKPPFSVKANLDNVDFSKIPSDIAYLIKDCLNEDPKKRPTVSDIRKSCVFEEIPKIHNSSSFYFSNFFEKEESFDISIMSRVSEFLEKPLFEIEALLLDKDITSNEAKVLYFLVSEKIRANTEMNSVEKIFHSLPGSSLSNSDLHEHSGFMINKELTIEENGYKIDEALKELLLPNKFCISTSLDGKKTVVLNLPGDDICFDLTIQENTDKKSCKLMLSGCELTDETMNDIVSYLQSKFHCS